MQEIALWEILVAVGTFGAFLFGFYKLLHSDIRANRDAMEKGFSENRKSIENIYNHLLKRPDAGGK